MKTTRAIITLGTIIALFFGFAHRPDLVYTGSATVQKKISDPEMVPAANGGIWLQYVDTKLEDAFAQLTTDAEIPSATSKLRKSDSQRDTSTGPTHAFQNDLSGKQSNGPRGLPEGSR